MSIKALFVDIGGVIVLNKAREVGTKYEEDGLTPEKTRKIFHFLQQENRSAENLHLFLVNEGVDPEHWNKFAADFYATESRNDELITLLREKKTEGILIVITTNNSDALLKGMDKFVISDLPNLIINSSDYKVIKPDREYWETAFRETQKLLPDIKPEEILVIDDSRTNCESAKEFGFNVYKYENTSGSVKEIAELI